MKLIVSDRWRVDASHSLKVPLPASTVWGQMRDIRRFIALDPLHKQVRFKSDKLHRIMPKPGDELVLEHRLLGVGPDRVGRLLKWNEGSGYAISDLSKRGHSVGFPHVCVYDVQPLGAETAQLTISARGRWTATWIPRWLVRCWLWWVMRLTAWRMERELLSLALFLRTKRMVTAR